MAEPALDERSLLRLLAWSSPSFPIGSFAFSHGLESAVEEGLVRDAATLADYVLAACRHGSGFADAVMLARAYERAEDEAALRELLELASALRGTAEFALETGMQGGAALRTLRAAWSHAALDRLHGLAGGMALEPSLPVVLGVAAHAHALPIGYACLAHLAAFSANLVSAGVRLIPLGQTDGQRVTALVEKDLAEIAHAALLTNIDELATSAPMIDLFSISHETQYTRLFRS